MAKWYKRNSHLSGYDIAHRLQDFDGSQIEVHLNREQQIARLTLQKNLKGKSHTYLAIVCKGQILVQGELESGRVLKKRIARDFSPYTQHFFLLPDKNTLEAIGGAFRIPRKVGQKKTSLTSEKMSADGEGKPGKLRDLSQRLRFFWASRVFRKQKKQKNRLSERLFAEIFDLSFGAFLIYLTVVRGFFIEYDSVLWCGAWGIISGWLDIYVRKRRPFLLKVYLLVFLSAYLIYDISQERLWYPSQ